jgi:carbamoyl-phosphate synthase large subunit
VNVLLTCAGSRVDIVQAFQVALAAGPHTGRLLISDAGEASPTRFEADGIVDLPVVDDPGYTDALIAACRAEHINAVLPLTDLDPVILASAAPALAAVGTSVFLPDPEVALGCQDKWECHLMLQREGLPSPPTWLSGSVDLDALPYPMLLKPRMGFAARHIYRAANPEELAFFERYSPLESVYQQALDGIEFSTDTLGDLQGRALGAIPRSMMQAKGGEQVKGESLDDPQLVDLAVRTVETLGLRGPACIQCFRKDGEIQGITDINTRFGGAFPLPLAAGGGYPELIVRMAAGEQPTSRVGTHRAGVVMTRYLGQTILQRTPDGLRLASENG